MTRRFRFIIFSLFLLISFISFDVRNASAVFDPLTGYIVVSAVLHAVAVGGYYAAKYFKRENGGSRNPSGTKATSSGTIGRDATVQWVDLTDGVPSVKSKDVVAKLKYQDVKSIANSNPARYPKLKSAMSVSSAKPLSTAIPSVGSYFISPQDGTVRKVLSKTDAPYYPNSCVNNWLYKSEWGYPFDGGVMQVTGSGYATLYTEPAVECGPWTPGWHWKRKTFIVFSTSAEDAPLVDATPSEFASKITNSSAPVSMPTDVFSDYYAEIDDMIKENPNVVGYSDTPYASSVETASPFVPALSSYSDYAKAVATQSANAAIAAASDAVDAANNAANNALVLYNQTGNPSDYQAYLDSLARANELSAQLAALQSAHDTKAADDAKDDEDSSIPASSSPSAYGDGSNFDFQARFSQFFTDVKATTLFSLPNKIVSSLPSGGSPVVSISCGRWGVRTVDFSAQSQILSIIKTILLIAFSFVAIKIVVLKGGGG